MKKSILFISIMLFASTASAERWIVCNETTVGGVTYQIPSRREGDCLRLGLCSGKNNTGINANVFEAQGTEWQESGQAWADCEQGNAPGNRITTLSQAQIDQINNAKAAQADTSMRERAKSSYDGLSQDSLRLKALVKVMLNEINILRQAIEDISAESIAITDKVLPARTLSGAKTAIKNAIDEGSIDAE